MALVLREIANGYIYAFRELADPRVNDWFLMRSPIPSLAIIGLYLWFIFDIGPNFMKNRKPYNIEKLLVRYNAIQIIMCLYTVIEGTRLGLMHYDWKCAPVETTSGDREIGVARVVWFYFMTKIFDLLDTVFFILRKKENQMSFLHIYHHAGMIALIYLYAKFLPGGQNMYTVVVNSMVHVVMYSYYLLSAYNPEYKKSIWWKRYITQMQLLQFGVLCLMHLNVIFFQPECAFPKFSLILTLPQHVLFFCLFGNFYYNAYVRPKKVAH